jgi:Peptidase family M28
MRNKLFLPGCIVAILILLAAGCGSTQVSNQTGRTHFKGKADTARMMATISYMSGEELQGRATGSPQSKILEDYLIQQLQTLGLQPAAVLGINDYRQEFPVPSERVFVEGMPPDQTVTGANLLGEIPGDPGSQILILAANYDGMGIDPKSGAFYPGADYNASGCSGVLELARLLTAAGETPKKTVVFALLGGEECGNFGSQTLAETIESAGLQNKVSIINLEGIGAGQGDYMDAWDLDYRKSKDAADALDNAASALGVMLEPGGADPGSSANVFFLFHQSAVTCDWSWYERTEHPDFHTTNDVPGNINRDGLQNVTEVVAEATWDLAYG